MNKIEEYRRYMKKCEMTGTGMFDIELDEDNIYIRDYIENVEEERVVRIPSFVDGVRINTFMRVKQRIKIVGGGLKVIYFNAYEGNELDLKELDTSELEYMNGMFAGCNNLKELNLSNINTSNVIDMGAMFSYCGRLEKVGLNNFDTSKVKYMSLMFNHCSSLKKLDLGSFDTSKVIGMDLMFNKCKNLEELRIDKFSSTKLESMYSMFKECNNLKRIITNREFKSLLEDERENIELPKGCVITVIEGML